MFIHSVPSSLALAEAVGMYRSELKKTTLHPHFKRQILSMGYLFKTHNQDIMPYIPNAELTFPPRPDFFFSFFKDTLFPEGLNLGTIFGSYQCPYLILS